MDSVANGESSKLLDPAAAEFVGKHLGWMVLEGFSGLNDSLVADAKENRYRVG